MPDPDGAIVEAKHLAAKASRRADRDAPLFRTDSMYTPDGQIRAACMAQVYREVR